MSEKLLIAVLKIDGRIISIRVEARSMLPLLIHLVFQKHLILKTASPGIVLQLDLQKR